MEQPQLYRKAVRRDVVKALQWTGTNPEACADFIGPRGTWTPDGDGQYWFGAADLHIRMIVGWWFVEMHHPTVAGALVLTVIPQDQFSDDYVAVS